MAHETEIIESRPVRALDIRAEEDRNGMVRRVRPGLKGAKLASTWKPYMACANKELI
jgi:hypothetical protein